LDELKVFFNKQHDCDRLEERILNLGEEQQGAEDTGGKQGKKGKKTKKKKAKNGDNDNESSAKEAKKKGNGLCPMQELSACSINNSR
jgi:hypothetical protein